MTGRSKTWLFGAILTIGMVPDLAPDFSWVDGIMHSISSGFIS
jgi:hypothetical protein